jgi:hypothetical protein
MTNTLITSGQIKQLRRFAEDAVEDAIEDCGYNKLEIQRVIANSGSFTEEIRQAAKEALRRCAFRIEVPAELPKIPMAPRRAWELYLHEKQENDWGILGSELEKHLKQAGRLDRAFSIDDDLIKGWFANPETYPEELKKRNILLWKPSPEDPEDHRQVVCLIWINNRVITKCYLLTDKLGGDHPALLKV